MPAQKSSWGITDGMAPNVPNGFYKPNTDSTRQDHFLKWDITYKGQTKTNYMYVADYELYTRLNVVEKEIKEIKKNQSSKYIEINRLLKKNLSKPLGIIVEPDADGFIARTPDLPIYGFGDDIIEAIDALKAEIESLYEDLMEDDDFTKDWLSVKKILNKLII
jgi:hypothetical protein